MIKAIFFDFDLTLVNSRPGAEATYNALWLITGQKPTKAGFQKYVGLRFSDMIDNLHRISKLPKKDLVEKFNSLYLSKIPKMGFYGKKLLPKLTGVKVIILTNNHRKSVEAVCRHFNIKYDLLMADEDMKPDERKHDAIKRVLKRFRFKHSEVLYVGDHINDVIEAHRAGIKSAIVPTGVFEKIYIKRYHPDYMLSSIDRVTDLIK